MWILNRSNSDSGTNERNILNTRAGTTNENLLFEANSSQSELSMIKTLIKMTDDYPTVETWNTIKNAIEDCSSDIFTRTDALNIIQNANKYLPNEDPNMSFALLSCVSLCVYRILDHPFIDLIQNDFFLQLYDKFHLYFQPGVEFRSTITVSDIVRLLAKESIECFDNKDEINPRFENICTSILDFLGQPQTHLFFVAQMINTLGALLKMDIVQGLNVNKFGQILIQYMFQVNSINGSISPTSVSDTAIEVLSTFLEKFPDFYEVILNNADFFNALVKLVNEDSLKCAMYTAKLLISLVTNEVIFKFPFQYNIFELLYTSCMKSKTNAPYLLEVIALICKISPEGCATFVTQGILNQFLISISMKATKSMLSIIHSFLKINNAPINEDIMNIIIHVVEQCIEDENEEILKIDFDVILILFQLNVNLDVREQLEDIAFGEYSEDVANQAQVLLKHFDALNKE
ncbi:hypothetical protein TRFO_29315 [Tritrichomonas foetus]|uniref:SPIN90/Ldb17 leucine-rich domain-containing protein n=1 Tax=Tritrichomonas foetus TaxID=1144522 RepID=A0A1J4JWF9_9EUKA|nr:hypothetical protein TRFO_29315 [Tritrichomonas foetus]|eukprot:OHT03331.1 hypothetical protein TRFO_29315 [Tritrichomonas foetus]